VFRRFYIRLTIAIALSLCAIARVDATELVSMMDLAGAISRANQVSVSAYTLGNGPILHALVLAAARGAQVNVVLDRFAFTEDVRQQNRELKKYLDANKVPVTWSRSASHIKAIIADGTLYLSDVNFSARNGMVIADTNALHLAAVQQSINTGTPAAYVQGLAIRKNDALAVEANVMSDGIKALVFQSESFGAGTKTYDALVDAARSHRPVRVIVARREYDASPGEQRALAQLASAGVQIHISPLANEKIAVSDRAAWLGSANSTRGVSDQIEWGMVLTSPSAMAILLTQFESNWNNSTPLASAP
jgi:hypothetical protein